MKRVKLGNVFSWASSAAVLIGMVLVILQLRQNQQLVELQIATDIYMNQKQFESSIMGDNFAETLAKVHSSPTTLSDAELYQFDSYAYAVIDSTRNFKLLHDAGLIREDWEVTVTTNSCYFFNNPVGRAYLNSPALSQDDVVSRYKQQLEQCAGSEGYLTYMKRSIVSD